METTLIVLLHLSEGVLFLSNVLLVIITGLILLGYVSQLELGNSVTTPYSGATQE